MYVNLRLQAKYNTEIDPYPSPTVAVGILAADRKYFFEIGGYDDDMDALGAENLELSFRTWMCGGSLEFIPCSHVGHVFHPGHPYDMTNGKGKSNHNDRNLMRLAEVWLDDYKRLFYLYRKDLIVSVKTKFILVTYFFFWYQGRNFGDISNRVELRKRLSCHSFKWYLKYIHPEKFILDENVYGYGEVSKLVFASI